MSRSENNSLENNSSKNNTSKNTGKWLLILLVIVMGAIGFRYARLNKGFTGQVGAVKRSALIERVTIAGSVMPNRKTVISAPYAGYVNRIFVKIGEKVKSSAPIVTLSQSARADADGTYPLRAPFDGTVVQVLRTEGEFVELSGPIVRIDDLSQTYVDAGVPEVEVGRLKLGQAVVIKSTAILAHQYHGVIRTIALAAKEQKDWDKSRVEFSVNIEISDNDGRLRPGMSVVADIITKKLENVLTLGHEYIQKNDDGYFVMTADGNRKKIQLGEQNEEVFEIKSGLIDGERVRLIDFLSMIKE